VVPCECACQRLSWLNNCVPNVFQIVPNWTCYPLPLDHYKRKYVRGITFGANFTPPKQGPDENRCIQILSSDIRSGVSDFIIKYVRLITYMNLTYSGYQFVSLSKYSEED
jgi:hypothetical protein